MARQKSALRRRDVEPGFWTNEDLVELGSFARLFFQAMWCQADREGRLEDRPGRIRLNANMTDITREQAEQFTQALADSGFILRYEVNGERFIQVVNFSKHQKIHPRERPSEIPPPNGEPKANHRQAKGEPRVHPKQSNSRSKDEETTKVALGPSGPSGIYISEGNVGRDGAKTRDTTPAPLPVRKRTKIPEGARQTAVQMIRAMAAERDVPWPEVLERAGGEPPWKPDTVTALKAWLMPMPKFSEAELDQRRRSRRAAETSGGPRAGPRPIGDVIGGLCQSGEASP